MPDSRFDATTVSTWHRDGAVLLERFFTPEAIAPCRVDMETLYGGLAPAAGEPVNREPAGRIGVPRPGAAFWTESTLRRTQQRWPEWDLTPWRTAVTRRSVA